jgi:hypothetical protein
LTLSGFPFHINLKHLLSISFLDFFGITHELTIKVKEGLWIGKLKHSKGKVENIKWTNKPIKSLGIYYGHD